MSRTGLLAASLAALAVALPCPWAQASADQVSIMQDDDVLLYGSDAERDQALDGMRRLGVDTVRVTVLWRVFAPKRRTAGFDGANPASYSAAVLNRLDRVVRGASVRGMTTYFDVTPPGPRWAGAHPPTKGIANLGTYKPRRLEFAKFVAMLGRRFDGTYADENETRRQLPRVSIWGIGNEPNQAGWLTPQAEKIHGRWVPIAPSLYRDLFTSARGALDRAGHGGDLVFMGELAPLGRSNRDLTSPLRPLKFLREMFCLDGTFQPFVGRSASDRGCDSASLGSLRTSGFAYHPYTRKRTPFSVPGNRDEATISNLKRVTRTLDRIAGATGRIPAGLPLWVTEFGYETAPPDPFNGVSLDQQSAYSNQGDFLAYRNPRVAGITQFQLRDASPNRRFRVNSRDYWGTYQAGLLYSNGIAKPAAGAYKLPIQLSPAGRNVVNFWGQVRFRPNVAPHGIEVQFQPPGRNWVAIGPIVTNNPRGFFEQKVPIPATGRFRAVWRNPQTGVVEAISREVAVVRQ